jgi:hypothetical protein
VFSGAKAPARAKTGVHENAKLSDRFGERMKVDVQSVKSGGNSSCGAEIFAT